MFGSELGYLSDFNALEKVYIRLLGSLSISTIKRYLNFKYFALKYFKKEKRTLTKFLDFGCAFGGFAFMLARNNAKSQVYLYDNQVCLYLE